MSATAYQYIKNKNTERKQMKQQEMLDLMNEMYAEEAETHKTKSQDYATRDGSNVFANFERVGELLGVSREMALAVYLQKHMDRIYTWIKHGSVTSESIEESIKDARVYLALLRGMADSQSPPKQRPDLFPSGISTPSIEYQEGPHD